jgi:hypothetical protein
MRDSDSAKQPPDSQRLQQQRNHVERRLVPSLTIEARSAMPIGGRKVG